MDFGDHYARLASLSQREREVLRRKCDGLDYKTIGQELNIAVPTVKADMARVYVKLNLDQLTQAERLRALFEVYCPKLREAALPPELPEPTQPLPLPEHVQQAVDDDERAIVIWQPRLPAVIEKRPLEIEEQKGKPRRPRPLRWMVLGMILGVLLIAALFFGLRGTDGEGTGQVQVTPSPPTVRIAEITVVVTPTPAPQQPTETPRDTVTPRQVTVVVTATPLPPTPEPTATPTPALVLPFQDNFDGTLRPEWRVLTGQPVFINGRLQAAGGNELTLQVGDSSLGNYTVGFDSNSCNSSNDAITITIAERVQFYFRGSSFYWQAYDGSSWITLPGGGYAFLPSCAGNLRITVAGNSYTVVFKNNVVLEAQYGTPLHGPLTIAMRFSQEIDNLSVNSP